jgi:3',5'-cyclic AMP phosphodiesterase CpdA
MRHVVLVTALTCSAVVGLGCGDFEDVARCGGTPRAWVMGLPGSSTGAWLRGAGFAVEPLPLDRSPAGLQGLIVIGSNASEMPEYLPYMERYADDLYRFAAAPNVLLELAQRPDAEAAPPFLPEERRARRGTSEIVEAQVLAPDHPLLAGVPVEGGRLAWRGLLARHAFADQAGFQVLVAGEGDGASAALLEAEHESGRILLAALPIDWPAGGDPSRDAFARAFFANLPGYVSSVCRRRAPAVLPTAPPAALPFTPGSTSFVVLPDTQEYARRLPGAFESQTAWIARSAQELGIRYVFHLGDLVNNNSDLEWSRARAAMSQIDGVVPYVLATGNHDHGPEGNASTRESGLNRWFAYDEAASMKSFGGAFEAGKLDSTYHLFEAGGHRWIALALEWAPRDQVVAWANQVMSEHPDRLGILITHAYLDNDDRRFDHTDGRNPQEYNPHDYRTPGNVNDGEELWQKLVRRHRFVMVLSGHVLGDGTGYLASTTDLGNTCHQLLSNYQMRDLGGEGYLRILELLPDGRTLVVRTYSPLLDRYLSGADQQMSLTLDP